MRIAFGSYRPDLPHLGNPGMTLLENVVPHAGGFRPLASLTPYTDALDARCQGGVFVKDKAGNVFAFAGDAAKLYRMSGGSTVWIDESKGGGYTTPSTGHWRFTQYGEQVIATNLSEAVQEFTIGSSTDFADLGGSPPNAKYVTVVRPGFVMLARLADQPRRVRWSAIGNPASWPAPGSAAARIVQSDQTDLEGGGGEIQGIVSGLNAADVVIIQETGLHRGIYVQPPVVFSFDHVEGARGTPAPGSIVQLGGVVYYLGEDGFFRFDGQSSVPIGGSRIDRTFFSTADPSLYHLMDAAVDPVNKLIVWAYADGKGGSAANNQLLIYNWEIDEWSPGTMAVEQMMRSLSFGYDMDTDLDASETVLDDPAWPPLDSPFWKGGSPGLAAFDANHTLAIQNGAPLDAVLETGETQIGDSVVLVNHARPLVETKGLAMPEIMVKIASRYLLTDPPAYRQAYAPTVGGNAFARSRGRYHRARVTIIGDWSFAQGIEIDGAEVGG